MLSDVFCLSMQCSRSFLWTVCIHHRYSVEIVDKGTYVQIYGFEMLSYMSFVVKRKVRLVEGPRYACVVEVGVDS